MSNARRIIGLLAALAVTGPAFAQDTPKKDESKEPLRLDVHHREDKCALYEEKKTCREEKHWMVDCHGKDFTESATLRALLKEEADTDRNHHKKRPELSDRKVLICGEATAPYGLIQDAMVICASVGIYKVELCVAKPGEKKDAVKAWISTDRNVRLKSAREEIPIFMKYDQKTDAVLRKVANCGLMDNDKDLMDKVVSLVGDFNKAKEIDVPVIIDATADVPFSAVIHVFELCIGKNLIQVEFAAPMR